MIVHLVVVMTPCLFEKYEKYIKIRQKNFHKFIRRNNPLLSGLFLLCVSLFIGLSLYFCIQILQYDMESYMKKKRNHESLNFVGAVKIISIVLNDFRFL